MPEHETPLEPLQFKVPGNIIRGIGRESISNPVIALLELVKNAYDEDATEVIVSFEKVETSTGTVTISDDGNGMTENELRQNWCELSTNNKKLNPKSPRLERTRVGEKGLARFAADCLAEKLRMVSKPRGLSRKYTANVNWDDFDSSNRIWDVDIPLSKSSKSRKNHGLTLILSGLRTKWEQEEVENVRRNLRILANPLNPVRHFRISFNAAEFPTAGDRFPRAMLKQAIFQLRARLGKTARITFELTDLRRTKERRHRWKRKESRALRCGSIDFRLYFYYRTPSRYLRPSREEKYYERVKAFLDKWQGIKIYRDNFRVMPYGELDNDWLGLDDIRVQESTYPGNDQVFGIVSIDKKSNPSLVDVTTREALVDNFALKDLRRFLEICLDEFVARKNQLEHRTRGKKPKRVSRRKKTFPDEPLLKNSRYPSVAYRELENEVNDCVKYNRPNAALLLARKMVENLVFSLLRKKYPKEVSLWWDSEHTRPYEFSVLLQRLQQKKTDFRDDQQRNIDRLNALAGTFRLEANRTAHDLYEWLDDRNQLSKLRIPLIVELLLELYA
jgi:hypothetical protein